MLDPGQCFKLRDFTETFVRLQDIDNLRAKLPWTSRPNDPGSRGRRAAREKFGSREARIVLSIWDDLGGLAARSRGLKGYLVQDSGDPIDVMGIAYELQFGDDIETIRWACDGLIDIGWLQVVDAPTLDELDERQGRKVGRPKKDGKNSGGNSRKNSRKNSDETPEETPAETTTDVDVDNDKDNTPQSPPSGGAKTGASAARRGRRKTKEPSPPVPDDCLDAWDRSRRHRMPPVSRPPSPALNEAFEARGSPSASEIASRAAQAALIDRHAKPHSSEPLTLRRMLDAAIWSDLGDLTSLAAQPPPKSREELEGERFRELDEAAKEKAAPPPDDKLAAFYSRAGMSVEEIEK